VQPMSYRLLSILMPLYNERATVDLAVEQVMEARLPEGLDRELIVGDDGSSAGSAEVLEPLLERYRPRIKLVRQNRNRGKGAAINLALQHATGDICIIQDADLEYDPGEYGKILRPILEGNADVVYGSRFLSSDYRRVLYFWHAVGNRLLTLLSNMATNLNLTDMETCYKAAKSSIIKTIPIRSRRFEVEAELTSKFAKRGCAIYEVRINYRGRTYEEGKKVTWWDGVKTLVTILYFWLVDDLYRERYGHAILHRLDQTRHMNRWMFDRIKEFAGDAILEVGAGIGNLTRHFLPRHSFVASDIDPLYLDLLKNRFAGRRNFQVIPLDLANGEGFGPLAGRFDTVVCLNVLEHIEDDRRGLENIFSALRPGGRAVILVPYGQWLFGSLDRVLEHKRRYGWRDLTGKCQAAGFEIEKWFYFNKVGLFGGILNSLVLRKKSFSKIQLKLYDSLIWLWRWVDRLPLLPGLSIVAVVTRPSGGAAK